MDALGPQPGHVGAVENAALGDQEPPGGDGVDEAQGGLKTDLEAAQIAVVDADQPPGQGQGPLQLRAVVDLDQDIQAQGQRQGVQVPQLGISQAGGDQQDAIRPQDPGLQHLVGVQDEVLADDRQRTGGTGLPQVVVTALEKIHVGENRETGRPAARVAQGNLGRIKIRPQDALAGRGLLDLGDHRRQPGVHLGRQGSGKAPGRGGNRQLRLQTG